MDLVIVESPTKAKTIKKFLGKKYHVLSSFGHIRDLPKSELGIDEKKNFEPKYVIPLKARKAVSSLRKEAKKVDRVILATDEDREGEAIAWHIIKALKLKEDQVERIVFHEITKDAILEAIKHPRKLDEKLVDAQKARRILDRLVGYKLSPFLWKKITRGLSAGRVQSVAVRLICEREEEIKKFKEEEYWKISTFLFKDKKNVFESDLAKIDDKKLAKLDIKDKKQAGIIKKDLEKSKYSVNQIERKLNKKNPLPPYRTSTLQQDAAIRLRYSSKKTMFLAQKLYEGIKLGSQGSVGLITYMRTDSTNLATSFLAETQKYLKEKLSFKYAQGSRNFKTKTKGAQEAHEAIRPTSAYNDPESVKEYLPKDQFRLYELIWNRAIASQMTSAQIESTILKIQAKGKKNYELRSKGEVIKFDGFLKIYQLKSKESLLPALTEKDELGLKEVKAEQKFTQPPKRYSEAMLIKVLEKHGIGRPSTYAPIISTVQTRGYVKKNDQRRFEPTEVGLLVNNLLVKHFENIVDYDFTAQMEKDLDEVAEGKKDWQPVVESFYGPFAEKLKKNYKVVKSQDGKKIGKKCPKCGSEMVERYSRYGKFYACSNFPECKYTESIDGESNEPKKLDKKCPKCGGNLVERRGRFGKFIGCENYPKCKYIDNSNSKTGVKCPKCGEGEIVIKRTKKKRIFYACNRYPECKFALWQKPTGEKCPKCGSLLVETPKGKIICSNKKLCDYVRK